MARRPSVHPYHIPMVVGLVDMTLSSGLWLLLETHALLGMLALFTVVWASTAQPFAPSNVHVELRSSSRGIMLCERRIPSYHLRTAATENNSVLCQCMLLVRDLLCADGPCSCETMYDEFARI